MRASRAHASIRAVASRHRRTVGVSGAVLFACIALPAVDACGPLVPLKEPALWPPYLHGLAIALTVAFATSPWGVRQLRRASIALSAWTVTLALWQKFDSLFVTLCAIELIGLAALGPARSPRSVARHAIAIGLGYACWFGVWLGRDARYGLYLTVAAAIGLAVGGWRWLDELDRP
jgi:hypothetical protein